MSPIIMHILTYIAYDVFYKKIINKSCPSTSLMSTIYIFNIYTLSMTINFFFMFLREQEKKGHSKYPNLTTPTSIEKFNVKLRLFCH